MSPDQKFLIFTGADLASSLGQQMPPVLNNKTKHNKKIPTMPSPQKTNKQNPSVRAYSISKRGKRAFRSLNKISHHPFRASISTSLKTIQRGTTSYKRSSSAEPFLGQVGSPARSLKPHLLLLCWVPVYHVGIMFLGSLPAPLCCLVKQDQMFPTSLKAFGPCYTALFSNSSLALVTPSHLSDGCSSHLLPSPHPGPKPAILPSWCRPFRLSQLLTSTLSHCLSEMLPHLPPSFHLNAFLMHCYAKKAFRKTFRKGLLGPPSIKLYYSFSVSF